MHQFQPFFFSPHFSPEAPSLKEKKYYPVSRREQEGSWITSGTVHQRKEWDSLGQGSRQVVEVCKVLPRGSVASSTRESPSGVAAGFCATALFSLLQRGNKQPWNGLTFGIILSLFFFPPLKSGALERKPRKARATFTFCQLSLRQ